MDPLFWILAGVVVLCVIGIIIIWRLEVQAEQRAADTRRVEAQVSARLKFFDPRAAVEEVDTRPIPAASQSAAQEAAPIQKPFAPLNLAAPQPPATQQSSPAAEPVWEASPQTPHEAEADMPPVALPLPPGEQISPANGRADYASPVEAPLTPELARARAAELGRERRYLEHAMKEQQDQLAHLLHIQAAVGSPESATISQLQNELAEQRRRLEELIAQEERYRQAAVPSLEQLARDYKNAASPHTPKAFGVRRHSLARVEPPGKNPPAPPAQAATDTPS